MEKTWDFKARETKFEYQPTSLSCVILGTSVHIAEPCCPLAVGNCYPAVRNVTDKQLPAVNLLHSLLQLDKCPLSKVIPFTSAYAEEVRWGYKGPAISAGTGYSDGQDRGRAPSCWPRFLQAFFRLQLLTLSNLTFFFFPSWMLIPKKHLSPQILSGHLLLKNPASKIWCQDWSEKAG